MLKQELLAQKELFQKYGKASLFIENCTLSKEAKKEFEELEGRIPSMDLYIYIESIME